MTFAKGYNRFRAAKAERTTAGQHDPNADSGAPPPSDSESDEWTRTTPAAFSVDWAVDEWLPAAREGLVQVRINLAMIRRSGHTCMHSHTHAHFLGITDTRVNYWGCVKETVHVSSLCFKRGQSVLDNFPSARHLYWLTCAPTNEAVV
jgi:hypothetical protein